MSLVELPGFIGQTYQTQSLYVDAERAINLLPEAAQNANTRSKIWYYARPGLKTVTTLDPAATQVSALYTTANDITYATQPGALYKLTNTGINIISNKLATIAPNVYDRLSITSSQTQLLVAANVNGYIYDGTSVTPISAPGFLGGNSFCQIKGYFIGFNGGNKIYSSDLLNGLSWNALNFSLVNSPDPPVAICTDQRELLWVFCKKHVQVYAFNAALTAFPFSVIDGAVMQVGLLARLSLAAMDNTLIWVGVDDRGVGGVYVANGFAPQKVSTPAVDAALSNYAKLGGFSQLQQIESYVYRDGGHEIYVMTIPLQDKSKGATWCYDRTNNMWTERSYWNSTLSIDQAHLGRNHTYNTSWGVHLVGDYQSANIYEQNSNFYSDPNTFIRRRRTAPVLWTGGNRNFFARLELGMQVGELTLPNDQAPQVSMRYSNDGGNSYGQRISVSSGKVGEFQQRVIWRQLGSAFQRNFEIVQTDAVRTAWTGAWIDMSQAPLKLGGK